MSSQIQVDIRDVKTIMRNYKAFDVAVQAHLEKVTNRSLGKVARGAKQRVSSRGVRTNAKGRKLDIKSRITTQQAKFSKGRTGGIVWSKAPHSHLVEFGTKAHALTKGTTNSAKRARSGKKQFLMVINGNPVSGTHVMHPGSKPKPFLQPAYLQERENYINAVKSAVKAETERKK